MTRSHKRFETRVLLPILCILVVEPVIAGEEAPDFRATVVAPANGTKIANDTVWRCTAGRCVAVRSPKSPRHVCSHLARKVGKIESFSFRGKALDDEALAECNQRAR